MAKFRISYAVLLLLIGLLYVFTNSAVTLSLLIGLLLMVLITGVLHQIFARKLCIELKTQKGASKRREAGIWITAKSTSPIPVSHIKIKLSLYNTLTGAKSVQTVHLSIPARGKQTVEIMFSSDYCGKVIASLKEVRSYDFLGMTSHRIAKPQQAGCVIYPSYLTANLSWEMMQGLRLDEIVYSQHQKGNDVNEVYDMHEYIPGDNVKAIHWKLSGKLTSGFLVRDFAMPLNHQILLLVDISNYFGKEKVAGRIKDGILETAAAIGRGLVQQVRFTIGWCGKKEAQLYTHEVASQEDLSQALFLILSAEVPDMQSAALRYYVKENRQELFSKVIYVTGEVEETDKKRLCALQDTRIVCVTDNPLQDKGAQDVWTVQTDKWEESVGSLVI